MSKFDVNLSDFTYDGKKEFDIFSTPTNSNGREEFKAEIVAKTQENTAKIIEYQEKLFSERKEAVLICLQALDGAGKDSTIKHVLSGINPLGIDVVNYRFPSATEANHDFLWRYHKNLPEKGKICIFNRTYYEEVLTVKVHEDYKHYKLPERLKDKDYIKGKYNDICAWENYLYGNSIRVIKLFLNISKEEQKRRFLERIDRPEKNWKFSPNDINERQYFEKYQEAFQSAINSTATKNCPWFVLPADQKWFTRYLASEAILKTFKEINPQFPQLSEEVKNNLAACRQKLMED